MELIVLAKAFCDIGFVMMPASLILLMCGQNTNLMPEFIIITLAIFVSYLFSVSYGEKWRYAGLPLVLTALIPSASVIPFFATLLICLYGCFIIHRRAYTCEYGVMADGFRNGFIAVIVILLITLIFKVGGSVTEYTLPIAIVYLISSVFCLTMLRHDAETLRSTRFKLMNISILLATILLGLAIVSQPFLNLLSRIGVLVWRVVAVPVIMIISTIMTTIIYLISLLVANIFFPDAKMPSIMEGIDGMPTGLIDDWKAGGDSPFLDYILIAVSIIALIFIISYAIKRLKARNSTGGHHHLATRESITLLRTPQKDLPREVRGIRNIYRRFLNLCLKRGMSISRTDTSLDIKTRAEVEGVSTKEDCGRLRALYIKARYSSKTISSEELQAAKQVFLSIKKNKI